MGPRRIAADVNETLITRHQPSAINLHERPESFVRESTLALLDDGGGVVAPCAKQNRDLPRKIFVNLDPNTQGSR
jgi:hypothetical protein